MDFCGIHYTIVILTINRDNYTHTYLHIDCCRVEEKSMIVIDGYRFVVCGFYAKTVFEV